MNGFGELGSDFSFAMNEVCELSSDSSFAMNGFGELGSDFSFAMNEVCEPGSGFFVRGERIW